MVLRLHVSCMLVNPQHMHQRVTVVVLCVCVCVCVCTVYLSVCQASCSTYHAASNASLKCCVIRFLMALQRYN